MSRPSRGDRRARQRRVTGPWRWALLVYAIALTTATHWPRLALPPESPATDKTIHAIAFALVTFLLWRSRWISSRRLAALIAGAWAVLDELSQGIPALHRVVSWQDVLANELGVLVMLAWLGALQPVGGASNRMRLALAGYVLEELFGRWRTWLLLAGVCGGCLMPLVILWPGLRSTGTTWPTMVTLFAAGLAGGLILHRQQRLEMRRTLRRRPCFQCGQACPVEGLDEHGAGRCPSCGEPLHAGQWSDAQRPPIRVTLRLATAPMLLALGVLVAGIVLIIATPIIYAKWIHADPAGAIAPRLAHAIGTLPREVMDVIDLAAFGLLVALATRLYRARIARVFDQSARCLHCGHDLRGTPTTGGLGRCGECGARFVRRELTRP